MQNSEFRNNRFKYSSSRNFQLHVDLNLVTRNSEFCIGISAFVLLILLSFNTLASIAQSPILKIGLMADLQYCDCETAGTRHYRLSLGKTQVAVDTFLNEKVDFTVLLGDMIDRDVNSFGPVHDRLEPLKPDVTLIPGNHDFALGEGKKADRTRKALRIRFPEARTEGKIRMLFLNGMMNSIEAWPEGSHERARGLATFEELKAAGAPNAQEWNGGLGERQLRWIRNQVSLANQRGQYLILFCHLPALPGDVHSLWDTQQLLDILRQSQNPVLYLCGHKHSGGDDQVGNCRIVNLKGMVEGTRNAFGVLEVYPGRYVLKGYGDQPDDEIILK